MPGFVGGYKYEENIVTAGAMRTVPINSYVKPLSKQLIGCVVSIGSEMRLDKIVFEPPRFGPTIWEIGLARRKANECYVPDPSPRLMNKLYLNSKPDRFDYLA